MFIGDIVEYIDQQQIISAVILYEKKGKLRLLGETNREVSFSEKRLSHASQLSLDTSLPRYQLVRQLKEVSENRKKLSEKIDIKELWEILHQEPERIDISTMTLFCFDPPLTSDHEAAVIRAFFNDRVYFKFNRLFLVPYSIEQVDAKKQQIREAEKKATLIRKGVSWIQAVSDGKNRTVSDIDQDVLDILKSYYLFGNDSDSAAIARKIVKKSGFHTSDQLFGVFVKAGVWEENQNLDLLAMDIPTSFSSSVLTKAKELIDTRPDFLDDPLRKDLTHIPLITIDGHSTLDFDDAISLETTEKGYTLGIHIIDVGTYIKSNDKIDLSARYRGSSIYMPDDKLSMIPSVLSEDLCSLKKGEVRPGISTVVKMNHFFEILDYNIVPSIIKVHKQITYTEANLLNGKNDSITTLYKIATLLREKRLKAGAIQITLPEINVWLEDNREIRYSKIDRENPSRMLVSEMMIFANSLMAEFLVNNDIPAVFRSQAQPKQRFFKGIETSLILNIMQRKHLNPAMIGIFPESHAGLGVKAYVTATSPIRRYHDLLTQRQIKSVLGYGRPYSRSHLEDILQTISMSVTNAIRIQTLRKRYWIIKYIESMRGNDYEALVLERYKDCYYVLMKEFMLEAKLSLNGMNLEHGDIVQVTVQHADARKDQLSLFV